MGSRLVTPLRIAKDAVYIPEDGHGERARTKKLNISPPPAKEMVFDPPIDREKAMSLFNDKKEDEAISPSGGTGRHN